MPMTPEEAYEYALEHGHNDETRKFACKDPECAYKYARDVDKTPRDDTREAVCKNSRYAYSYIREVDNGKIHPIFVKALKPLVLTGDKHAVRIFNELEEMTDANDTYRSV